MIFKASLDRRDACCLAISCKALCNLTTDSKLACTNVNLVLLDVINSVYLIDDHGCTIKKLVTLSTKLLLLQDCIYEVYLIDFPLCVRWKTGHQL